MTTTGFVGLGNMGSVLAANLAERGHDLVVFDVAGPDRAPSGARVAGSLAELARGSEVVVLSLPDGAASAEVVGTVADAEDRRATTVIDASTIGPDAARDNERRLDGESIGYVDAPVSGGPAGARARTLSVMFSGTDDACRVAEPVLADLSENRHRVGERAGLAQAMKLANNFLSATALAATSEAVAFGRAAGLDISTMLEVLNVSSGRNSATEDKFPNHVVTGTYGSGFAAGLMGKDIGLYLDALDAAGGSGDLARTVVDIWHRFAAAEPDADFTRIFPFVAGGTG